MKIKADILIIGGGISGLSLAIKLAELSPKSQILLITKEGITELHRLSNGDKMEMYPSWEYYNKAKACHRAAGVEGSDDHMNQFMLKGAIDELKVWNYSVDPGRIKLAYDEGETIMMQSWFKDPEKMREVCPGGNNNECPAGFDICLVHFI